MLLAVGTEDLCVQCCLVSDQKKKKKNILGFFVSMLAYWFVYVCCCCHKTLPTDIYDFSFFFYDVCLTQTVVFLMGMYFLVVQNIPCRTRGFKSTLLPLEATTPRSQPLAKANQRTKVMLCCQDIVTHPQLVAVNLARLFHKPKQITLTKFSYRSNPVFKTICW